MKQKAVPAILGVLLVVFYALWLLWPITIITADIGRHITDGRIFFEFPQWRHALLHTNFYSTSHPDFPIVNHHWLAGLLFYVIQAAIGWKGLHLFVIALCMTALLLFVRLAARFSNGAIASAIAILLLPMIAYRLEIRPEFFGYLFMGLICSVLAIKKYLYALPVIMVLWVNIHASFPLGIALIGLCTVDAVLRNSPLRLKLSTILVISTLATLINPSGIAGALYPFGILRDPGYAVLENQAVLFLKGIGITSTAFTYLAGATVLYVVAVFVLLRRKILREHWPYVVMSGLMILMSWLAVRHIAMTALLLIPVFAAAIPRTRLIYITGGILVTMSLLWQGYTLSHRWLVLGLEPNANNAAMFMKKQEINGPMFNNFDIGGYAIYHFFPEIKPFAYNRPESHPSAFWRDVFIPMMQDDSVWYRELEKYDFNVILFYYGDRTPWAQEFLKARINDIAWIPVFADRNNIIFVRDKAENWKVIQDFGIPKDTFVFK
ncbi:MAG: hypothetical protein KC680_02295 [Candidatus Peregrinibacteria bacterium]|nr:hypothetical protein [Candidatus Peregrinibacteria bacterium]MCB9808696.1 hypothetical protein [Candidatus Peribacteria bacterium]